MKTIKIHFTLFILAMSIFACKKDKPVDPSPVEPTTIEEAITNIFQPMIDGDTAIGISVGVLDNGIAKTFFFGEKERGSSQKSDANTLYEIGSISKTMTTTILAKMVLDGDIKLDDPVEEYLPEVSHFPNFNGQKITFRHLADHTSALPNIPNNLFQNDFDESNPFKNYDSALLHDFLEGYELTYAPGTQQEYSNLALGLLGHVLAKIKNTTFKNLLQEEILNTMSLNNSHMLIPGNESNVAIPYDGRLKPATMWDMSDATLGAGGVKSSLTDMMQYMKVQMGDVSTSLDDAVLLTHETSQELKYPFTMGLGWVKIVSQVDGTNLIWHNGGTSGTVAFIGFVKELDLGVVILINTEINERINEESSMELVKGIQVISALKEF